MIHTFQRLDWVVWICSVLCRWWRSVQCEWQCMDRLCRWCLPGASQSPVAQSLSLNVHHQIITVAHDWLWTTSTSQLVAQCSVGHARRDLTTMRLYWSQSQHCSLPLVKLCQCITVTQITMQAVGTEAKCEYADDSLPIIGNETDHIYSRLSAIELRGHR